MCAKLHVYIGVVELHRQCEAIVTFSLPSLPPPVTLVLVLGASSAHHLPSQVCSGLCLRLELLGLIIEKI